MHDIAEPELTLAAFEVGDVDADGFDHQAHVYVAWCYLGAYPVGEAVARFTAAIKRLTEKLGVPGKYHETITWFYLLLIAERRAKTSSDSWSRFRRENDDLFDSSTAVLNRYYSGELLWSDRARQGFVLPDRLAA